MPAPAGRRWERPLACLGLPVSALHPIVHQPPRRTVLTAATGSSSLRVEVWGRMDAAIRFVERLWGAVWLRDPPKLLSPTLRGQVDEEARIERLARAGNASVPEVVVADVADGVAVLVERLGVGIALAELDPATVDDDALDLMWARIRDLHDAGVVHGKLDAHHVVMTDDGPIIVGFEAASITTSDRGRARDVAQMLAATAAIVGPERGVAAAARVLGDGAVAAALAYVQPKALSGWTHDAFGGPRQLERRLAELRASAEGTLSTELAAPDRLFRVHPRTLLMAIGTFVAIATLLVRIGDPSAFWDAIDGADWAFVVLAFALGMLRDVVYGITFLGNVPVRLPIWPSIELQVAMAFSNLAVPVAADSAIQVRFLQRNGLDVASAIATGGVLSTVTEIAVQVGLFIVALRLAPDTLDFGRIDATKLEVLVACVFVVLAIAAAVILGVRRVRLLVLPPVRRALRSIWHAVRSPARLALLVGGNIAAQLLTAASLVACLAAFGAHVEFWSVLAISIGVGLVSSLVPVPGGGIAVSAVGLAGMLTAVGVPQSTSAAAVLAYQVAHSYVPAIPGWFATHDLIRKRLL